MFRSIMLSLMLLVLSVVEVNAADIQGSVQYWTIVKNGFSTPRFVISESAVLGHGFGWALYAQTDRNWSEAYIGPTYQPVKWLKAGIDAGIESKTKVNRYAGFGWVGYKNLSGLFVREYGASGGFTAVDLKASHRLGSASFVYDTPRGHGAKVALNATKAYTIWAAVQNHDGQTTYRYAGQYNF